MAQNSQQSKLNDDEDDTAQLTSSFSYNDGSSGAKPTFDAMLKDLEQKLPSLDDEDSDFEEGSGDDIEIFQRPSGYGRLVIEDEDKDLDESLTSSDLSERWSWKNLGVENTDINAHNTDIEDVNVADTISNNLSTDAVSNWFEDSNRVADIPESSRIMVNNWTSPSPSIPPHSPAQHGDYSAHSASIQSAAEPPQVSTNRRSRASRRDSGRRSAGMKLSLGALENVDFDIALQNVVEGEYQRRQRSRSSSFDLFELRPGDNTSPPKDPKKYTELMQSLVSLSAKQSGKKLDIDPMSGAERSSRATSKYEAEEKDRQEQVKKTASSGVNTADVSSNYKVLTARPRMGGLEQKHSQPAASKPLRGTVFIDLRKTEQALAEEKQRLAVVQRVLKLNEKESGSSDSSSDSCDEDDRDSWFEQRRAIRQALVRGESAPTPTIRSQRKPVQRPATEPRRLTAMRSPVKKTSSPTMATSRDACEQSREPSPCSSEEKTAADVKAKEDELREKMEELELNRKRAAELQQLSEAKDSFSEHLKAQKPTKSVDKKRVAGQNTSVLYHNQVTHGLPLMSVPPNLSKRNDVVMLTVNLSNNNQMVQRTPCASSVDRLELMSKSYISLLSWLCSLVPDKLEDEDVLEFRHIHPFNVVGLQQMVVEGQLLLAVAITFTGLTEDRIVRLLRTGPSVKKKESFYIRYIQKYLSMTSLADVCPWVKEWRMIPAMSTVPGSSVTYVSPDIHICEAPMSTFVQVQANADAIQQYFGADIGFYMETIRSEEQTHYADGELSKMLLDEDVETTMILIRRELYSISVAVFSVLIKMMVENLDIAGIRLALPEDGEGYKLEDGPLLAIAARGTHARVKAGEVVGPEDPIIARQIAPNSLMAQFGGTDRKLATLHTPRSPERMHIQLCWWFGPRLSEDDVIANSKAGSLRKDAKSQVSPHSSAIVKNPPVALLSATTSSDCFVVISSLLPVKYISVVLSLFATGKFMIRGIRRRRLSPKQVSALGIPAEYSKYYMPVSDEKRCITRKAAQSSAMLAGSSAACYCHHCVPRPVTILHVSKENVLHRISMRLESVISHLVYAGHLESVAEEVGNSIIKGQVLHAAPYSDGLLCTLGRSFSKVPEFDAPASTSYIPPQLHSNVELEQISLMACIGYNILPTAIGALINVLGVRLSSDQDSPDKFDGLELLGVKWLPALNTSQARELTPYEAGQAEWKGSIKVLTGNSALVAVLRGVNCTERVKSVLFTDSQRKPGSTPLMDRIVTNKPELAYQLASIFFFDRELFADFESRPNTAYLPPVRSTAKSPSDSWDDEGVPSKTRRQKSSRTPKTPPTPPAPQHREEESIFKTMLMGPRPLVTVLVIKPDVLAKHKLAKVLQTLMQEKFAIAGFNLRNFTELEAACLQPSCVRVSEELHRQDIELMTSGPCLLLALFRENAIHKLEDILGPIDPSLAKEQSPFCLRGVYGKDIVHNGFYCSTSYPSSVSDIKQFFPDGLCCAETVDLLAESIASPGIDSVLSPHGRTVEERQNVEPDPYNLNRLNQVNCIVLLPPLVRLQTKHARFVDIVQCLQTLELEIVGSRMLWLTEEQAQQYLHVIKAGSFSQVPVLKSAPIIVLAVQGHNAVLSFDYLLEEGMRKLGLNLEDYKLYMKTAKEVSMAKRMLAFFFDKLVGRSCKLEIQHTSAESEGASGGADAVGSELMHT